MPPPASPGGAPPAPAGGESVQTAAMAAIPEGTPPAEAEAGGVLPAEAGVAPPIDDEVSVAAAAPATPGGQAPSVVLRVPHSVGSCQGRLGHTTET